MTITCPHCKKTIEMVGAKELRDEYGLSSNSVQHYASRGFPDPILKFGNRKIYLRSDVDAFVERRSQSNVEKAVETLMRDLEHLPPKEQEAARKLLEEKIINGKPTRRRRT